MTEHFNDIVIGSGSAGAVVAARLSEDSGRTVLLIEGGPDYRQANLPADVLDGTGPCTTSHDWGYQADSGIGGRAVPYLRGRILGGTSSINTAMALRGTHQDFAEWVGKYGATNWSFEELLPFFNKLENDTEFHGAGHGADGPIRIYRSPFGEVVPIQAAFESACVELGYKRIDDFNNPDTDTQSGVGPCPFNVTPGEVVRQSTLIGYVEPSRDRPNLTIVADHVADRVLFSGEKATGVVTSNGGVQIEFTADRIIISAGSIGTPALLIRSGIGPIDQLEALRVEPSVVREGVGRNLREHVFTPIILRGLPEVCGAADPNVQQIMRFTATGSEEANDMQMLMLSNLNMGGALGRGGGEFMPALYPGLQRPHSTGSVALASTDPEDAPIVNLGFLSDPWDRERLAEGVRLAIDLAETAALGEATDGFIDFDPEIAEHDDSIQEYLDATVLPGFHASGTARIGTGEDPMAVVDGELRVHGVSNLYVADASVMPNIVRANTNITTIMIGERAADILRRLG
ncbi:MAG: choline dehydrogenase [Marmoricola sp.]|nr:choline dehydrogenase [Marmoricola sp.]